MVGTVCLGAESSHKDLLLHSMLGQSLLLVRAGFAAERLCTVGPACAAGSWLAQRILAQDVFLRESSRARPAAGWRSTPAVQELRSAVLPPGLSSPGLGQSHAFHQVVVRCGGSWWARRLGKGRLCHRPAWPQAGLVAGWLGHGRRGWTQRVRFHIGLRGFIICGTCSRLAQTSYKHPCLHSSGPLRADCLCR